MMMQLKPCEGTGRLILVCILAAICLAVSPSLAADQSQTNDAYRIGPNDVVRILIFGEDDLSVERKVGGDGKIDYPLLGAIQVEGMTVEGLQKSLTVQLASGYLRHPKVSVSIVRHRNFFVGGEVKSPGGFPYEEGLTLQKAIAMAGGFTEKSDKADIKVTRKLGGQLETLMLDPDGFVHPDDLIYVAQVQKFYVDGEVRKPGDYAYEKGLTVHKAITIAGGFTEKAARKSTKVQRILNGKEQTVEVGLDSILLPGDIIIVPQRFF